MDPIDRDVAGRPDDASVGQNESASSAKGWTEYLRELVKATPTLRRRELHRTADALRTIMHRLHGSSAPAETLGAVATELEALATRLHDFPSRSLYEGFGEAPLAGNLPFAFFDHSPMLGRANPLAPPVELWEEDGVIRGRATFDAAYEGPPGCVHGGYVAAAFDEVLGSTQSLAGRPGMTAHLGVDYRSPTPLHTELRFEGRVTDVSGRKTMTYGTIHAGDRLCAEATGLFVALPEGLMSELWQGRDDLESGEAG